MQLGIVVAGDPWRFFKDIFADLESRYAVSVFERRRLNAPIFNTRINRYLFNRDLETFLEKNDVVFFEWASDLLAEASRLPKKARIVTRLHRYEMFQWSNQVNWANIDQVILVSHAMQQKFAERFPEHAGRTTVIHEAVDTEKFRPVNKAFGGDLGTLCFLNPRKRVYELVLAFAELNRQRQGFCLHIGGSSNKYGDYTDALHSLVRKLGLQSQVKFYGDVPEPQKWYGNIDVFTSNSFSEGLQVAPMEAMASGRYTLSHHWDGAEELLPKEHLYLGEGEWVEKVLRYADLTEEEKRREQEAMRALACEKFDLRIIQGQIRQVIEAAAQEAAVSA